jgi:hypothetical protein
MIKDNHPYRILIVEDNPGDLFIIKDLLAEHMPGPRSSGQLIFALPKKY